MLAVLMPYSAANAAEPGNPGFEKTVVGKSIEGRPIHTEVYGDGDDVLMVIATIHGNEAAGTPLVAAFGEWLAADPEELVGRKVVIVPVANPDGMAAGERENERGVDLNRNFPAGNWEQTEVKVHGETPLSEPESRVLMQLVCHYFPHRIVSIHQPLECVDYDGPAEGLASAMAAACPLPLKKLGGRPGSLGSFVGLTLERPIITLELPKDAGMDSQELWRVYGDALIAALRYEGDADR
jgi:murein peptide amidase A